MVNVDLPIRNSQIVFRQLYHFALSLTLSESSRGPGSFSALSSIRFVLLVFVASSNQCTLSLH